MEVAIETPARVSDDALNTKQRRLEDLMVEVPMEPGQLDDVLAKDIQSIDSQPIDPQGQDEVEPKDSLVNS